ncbi:ammonium transporter Rh type B isoform X2 [Balaenoptera acutorostrata]|uniref:Ammonium transporter Rh type B n=1 Tax=Balaenoptera acutorostrata TaxID=9767 RepID=A0ABM3THP0_BALAC|nr:ammonium transporter Rh type B isoform X2 [Balaenoptera acutorostrata]
MDVTSQQIGHRPLINQPSHSSLLSRTPCILDLRPLLPYKVNDWLGVMLKALVREGSPSMVSFKATPELPGCAHHDLRGLRLPHGLPAALRLQQRGLHLPLGRLCPAMVHTRPGVLPLLPRWPHPCRHRETGPAQLLLMALLEVVLFGLNEFVLLSLLGVKDAGGSMTIHTFGAYFGLVLSRVLYRPQLEKSKHRQGSVYHSDLFAMIGTIFLWIFWPSFNSAPTTLGDGQHRTALNTYYSLTASTLSTFALSALVGRDGRLDMVHVQNAALAGGVVVGTSAEMMLTPFGALVAGFLAGTVSTLGYKFFTPILESKLKVQDTCGVHNLHGMPGVLGALLGVLVAGLATHEAYGDGLESVFPLLAKGQRSATSQAMHQLFGLFVTLIFASVGGSLGGLLLRLPFLDSPPDSQCYEDQIYWEVPGEHEDLAQGPLRAEEPETRA